MPQFDDRVHLTLGSKFEHNDFTGFEVQPNIRASWTPDSRNTLWASISRAVRAPAIYEHDGFIPLEVRPGPVLPLQLTFVGDDGFESETVIAYEIGYRVTPTPKLNLDLTAYYNDYDELRTGEVGTPYLSLNPLPPHLVVPMVADNRMQGSGYGVELAAKWRPHPDWRFDLAYTHAELALALETKGRQGELAGVDDLFARLEAGTRELGVALKS